jgi:hypothetical protein
MKLLTMQLHPTSVQIFSLEPCPRTPSVYAPPLICETKFHMHWQNYTFVFNLYIPRHQTGRQNTLNRMVASIPRI